jgi:hypothetical protein
MSLRGALVVSLSNHSDVAISIIAFNHTLRLPRLSSFRGKKEAEELNGSQ